MLVWTYIFMGGKTNVWTTASGTVWYKERRASSGLLINACMPSISGTKENACARRSEQTESRDIEAQGQGIQGHTLATNKGSVQKNLIPKTNSIDSNNIFERQKPQLNFSYFF